MMIRMPTMDATRNVAPPSLALLFPSLSLSRATTTATTTNNDDEKAAAVKT
jgi:hypothetical protein